MPTASSSDFRSMNQLWEHANNKFFHTAANNTIISTRTAAGGLCSSSSPQSPLQLNDEPPILWPPLCHPRIRDLHLTVEGICVLFMKGIISRGYVTATVHRSSMHQTDSQPCMNCMASVHPLFWRSRISRDSCLEADH